MKQSKSLSSPDRPVGQVLALAAFCGWALAALSVQAIESTEIMVKPPLPLPGGLGVQPVITSVAKTQELVTVSFFGIQGPFQVLHSTTANSNAWENFGPSTYRAQMTRPLSGDIGFFRVLSGRPTTDSQLGGTMNYVGAAVCADCHTDAHATWSETAHATAFDTLKAAHQENNAACIVCHTVGYGTPLGFKSEATTPHLVGVQCENCHGPGGSHVANVRDPAARPLVTMAAEVCGGCHNGIHHSTYDEWKTSAHATPNPDVASAILQQGEPRMLSCGPCHSGAVREALLEGMEHPGTPLPNRVDAAYFGITCAVCHDAHENMANPPKQPNPQLRNPLQSFANFSYNTSTNTTFAAQYNPDIQVCGQCHNLRGATWKDTSRSPHHSPQYNILVGQGAYDLGNPVIATHGAGIPNQCAQCHTHPHPSDNPTVENPSYTGHAFEVRFENCVICHISTNAVERAVASTQQELKTTLGTLKTLLDQWGTTKSPADLQTKYGALAWEYSTPGQLSNTNNDASIKGPTSAEQAKVPDAIKQARLNLYLIENDGSYGVHNGAYCRYLLNVAKTNVMTELNR